MTATDELRKLLDERGVEWSSPSGLNSSFADSITFIGNVAVVSEIDGSDLLRINFDGTPEQAVEATLGQREQPPYDELIEALRRDWDIEASWDGLRRFWYVGLTDEGVRKRDEREATLGRGLNDYLAGYQSARSELREENAKLRELVRAAWKCIHSGLSCSGCRFVAGGCTLESAMRELGVEVEP